MAKTAETLFEYRWPQTEDSLDNSEFYMLQEQVSDFLGVTSFKRKYPDLIRRIIDNLDEKDFLRDEEIVSETQFDLGLTALRSRDVELIMLNDFPRKYEEYMCAKNKKKDQEALEEMRNAQYSVVVDISAKSISRVIRDCAKWNVNMNKNRRDNRMSSYDLQNQVINYPVGKLQVRCPEETKMGFFPIVLLPGQFCDYFKTYSKAELKHFPINTVTWDSNLENNLPTTSQS